MQKEIETTRREMYADLKKVESMVGPYVAFQRFGDSLEAHLEVLRKEINSSAVTAEDLRQECDSLRNQLQALRMANQTAAEVIRGLKSELEESRECVSKLIKKDETGVKSGDDPYSRGFNGIGQACPYPVNTIERLHWMDGYRVRAGALSQSAVHQEQGMRSGSIGCNGQADFGR